MYKGAREIPRRIHCSKSRNFSQGCGFRWLFYNLFYNPQRRRRDYIIWRRKNVVNFTIFSEQQEERKDGKLFSFKKENKIPFVPLEFRFNFLYQ